MFYGRFLCLFIVFSMIAIPCPASAGWFFGDDSDWSKSGFDNESGNESGYDINTVVTVKGRVSEIKTDDDPDPHDPAQITIKTSEESVILVLGPKNFWQEKGIAIKKDDELTVRGSKAQGKNGKIYIFVQSLKVPSSDTPVTIRSHDGKPVWSGGGAGNTPRRTAPMRRYRGGRNH